MQVRLLVLIVTLGIASGCRKSGTESENARAKDVAPPPVTTVAPMRPTDEPPPKAEIDRAVNVMLAKRIDWELTNQNLFAEYKISNQYAETARGYTYFVYEFTAQCDVAADAGNSHGTYLQPDSVRLLLARNPSTKDRPVETKRVALEGSVTLVKKGIRWYVEPTLH